MRRKAVVSALLLVTVSGAVCWAGDTLPVDVAGRRVVLVAPKGMCFLDETVAWDRGDLEQQRTLGKGVNLTLAGVTDCGELTQIRRGKLRRASYFGYVKSPLPGMGNQPVEMKRPDFLGEIAAAYREEGATLVADAGKSLEAKLRGTEPVKVAGKPINLGVVFEGPDAVATALAIPLNQQGESFTRVAVMSLTLVNGIPVSLNLFRDYRDAATVTELVEESRVVAKALVAANP